MRRDENNLMLVLCYFYIYIVQLHYIIQLKYCIMHSQLFYKYYGRAIRIRTSILAVLRLHGCVYIYVVAIEHGRVTSAIANRPWLILR